MRGISDQADGLKPAADNAGWQYVAAEHAAAFSISLTALILQTNHLIGPEPRGQLPHHGAHDDVYRNIPL